MTWQEFFHSAMSSEITTAGAIARLSLSFVAGGIIGLNREHHKQPAGFRTHILICLGSTLLMILSIYIPQTFFDFKNGDPGRIAAQVVTGIGFLGAGAIIRMGSNIRGLTTAASIWLISAIGLTIGAGLYSISFIAVAFALFTLVVLERIEKHYFPSVIIKTLTITFANSGFHSQEVKKYLKKRKIHYQLSDLGSVSNNEQLTEIKFIVRIPENCNIDEFVNGLRQIKDVKSITLT